MESTRYRPSVGAVFRCQAADPKWILDHWTRDGGREADRLVAFVEARAAEAEAQRGPRSSLAALRPPQPALRIYFALMSSYANFLTIFSAGHGLPLTSTCG